MPRRKSPPLPPKVRKKIWSAIERAVSRNPHDEDRDPNEVIKTMFKGDESAYLRAMAPGFGIKLEV